MLTLAISKDFMDAFFIEGDKDENFSDLMDFLKKDIFNFTLLCDFTSDSDYSSAMTENPLWEMMLDKFDKINYKPNLNTDILGDTFYNGIGEQNLFMTALDEQTCTRLSQERGYLYISSLDISSFWEPLKEIRKKPTYKVTNDTRFPDPLRFDDWSKLEKFCLPLTSVVIFDKYILGDKANQKLSDNLFEILVRLCRNQLVKPLTLTIISEFERDEQITSSYNKIESFFKANGINNVNISLLRHDKAFYPPNFEGLHYRVILTNAVRIKSDDSFNFFKSNGNVNNDADLHFSLLLCNPSKCFFDKEIHDLKRYVSMLRNKDPKTGLANLLFYYKDKDNHLFN